MAHVIRLFDTFAEASEFARHLAKLRQVELTVGRVDGGWQVTSTLALNAPDYSELEAQLHEKDVQAAALRQRMADLQRQFQEVASEKERFRQRVIQHEAKPQSDVAESLAHSHARTKPLNEATCEACGRTLTFCRCAG